MSEQESVEGPTEENTQNRIHVRSTFMSFDLRFESSDLDYLEDDIDKSNKNIAEKDKIPPRDPPSIGIRLESAVEDDVYKNNKDFAEKDRIPPRNRPLRLESATDKFVGRTLCEERCLPAAPKGVCYFKERLPQFALSCGQPSKDRTLAEKGNIVPLVNIQLHGNIPSVPAPKKVKT